MEKYKILFSKRVKKELTKLPKNIRRKIYENSLILEINPISDVLDIKKLKGLSNIYRVRAGDYRMLYEIKSQELIVFVLQVGHRKDIYR